jgi:hypothetical protein
LRSLDRPGRLLYAEGQASLTGFFPEVMMKITADILEQAREALVDATAQKITLLKAVKEQGRKICDLEREVQKQMTAGAQAEQALVAARVEIDALRTQVPTDATMSAFESLTQFLASPAEIHPELRMAA